MEEMKKKHTGKRTLFLSLMALLCTMSIMLSGCTSTDTQSESESTTTTGQVTEQESDVTTVQETDTTTTPETEATTTPETDTTTATTTQVPVFSLSDIPAFDGEPYVTINGNVPYFDDSDLTTNSYESYSDLDSLGRCGVCIASIGQDIMPTEERGSIGSVKPTGWQTVKYNGVVDGNYLYNRCHLIGFQLAGENANTKNLITGTRYLNVDGMLPFENMVADYVKETNNHVLYRVTPIFDGNNLVASGVLMEAKSVEDNGDGILFNVYCYNNQPGVTIDYATGNSSLDGTVATTPETTKPNDNSSSGSEASQGAYAVNANNGKIHITGECSATGTGGNAMTNAKYFDTYEEAEAYSKQIAPNLDKRQCGNCW